MAYCRSLRILEGVVIIFADTIRIIVILSECCPVIDGITSSNLVLMKILNDPKSGTVTFWNNKLGSLSVEIGQVHDVIV